MTPRKHARTHAHTHTGRKAQAGAVKASAFFLMMPCRKGRVARPHRCPRREGRHDEWAETKEVGADHRHEIRVRWGQQQRDRGHVECHELRSTLEVELGLFLLRAALMLLPGWHRVAVSQQQARMSTQPGGRPRTANMRPI